MDDLGRLRATCGVIIGLAAAAPLAVAQVPADAPTAAPASAGWKVFPVPVLSYTPETRLMFGVAMVGVRAKPDSVATRPGSFLGAAVYTVNRQFTVALQAEEWTRANRWHLTGEVLYSHFPAEYYGSGPTTVDTSEDYTPETLGFGLAAQRQVGAAVYVGASYAFRRTVMIEVAPGGMLASGSVPGSTGGRTAILGADLVRDTRPSLYGPRHGHFVRFFAGVAASAVGSEFDFRRYTVDVRFYLPLGAHSVLGLQAVGAAVNGTVPFDALPQLGGQAILRGYQEPQFRDDAMAAAQAELRLPLRGRFGVALFAGAGSVAGAFHALGSRTVRAAGGAGMRFLLDPASGLNLRVDYAVAQDGGGLYLGLGDAF